MKGLFKRLLNVKGMVVEDVSIDDSPLRDAPVLVGARQVQEGRVALLALRAQMPEIRRRGRRKALAAPGLRLLSGRARGSGSACGMPCARRGGVAGSVGGAGHPVHARLRDGMHVADDGRQQEDRERFPACRVEDRGRHRRTGRRPAGIRHACMFDGLTAIGVDETSHRKGHTYITVVVDHERKRVIWAHDGYGKQVLALFFEELTPEQRASIRIVTGDGARWIDSSVAGYCPNAERVPDSFHIVSWMTDCLDRARKRLWNQARRANDKTAAEAMKGLKYAVLRDPGDLTERQSTALATLAGVDPKGQLYRSWQLKELLRTLLHQPAGQAEGELKRWINWASHSRIPEIVELCRKIRSAGTTSSEPSDPATPRATGGVQQQDQGHHTHGLRLPPRRQPHRHDQTPDAPAYPSDCRSPSSNPRKQQKPHFFIASTCSSTDMDAV